MTAHTRIKYEAGSEVLAQLVDELVADGEGFNVPEASTEAPGSARVWRSA